MTKFDGFVPPKKNYFGMPNEWIDICAEIKDISELKVIQYVLRHTWGFREYDICKTISVDEFMHGRRKHDGSRMDKGTKLSEQSVRNGLKKAIKDGYLICDIDLSDEGRIKKSYALKMHRQVQSLDPPQSLDPVQSLGSEVQSLDPQVQTLEARGINFIPRSEKDTIERHLEKDTIERQNDADASAHALSENVIDFKTATDGRMKAVKPLPIAPDYVKGVSHATHDIPSSVPAVPDPLSSAHGGTGETGTAAAGLVTPEQQTPGASPLPSAVSPPLDGHGDARAQALPSSGSVVCDEGPPVASLSSSPPRVRRDAAPASVIPKRPRYKAPVAEKAQLTLEGSNVKLWYEEVRGVRVRMIEKNIKDCNALGECEDCTLDTLKAVIEHLDKLKWVIEHDYPIDLHVLAGDSQLNFENNWPLVKRKAPLNGKSKADSYGNDYSLTALVARQQKAM